VGETTGFPPLSTIYERSLWTLEMNA
jgi:hypothetical protein